MLAQHRHQRFELGRSTYLVMLVSQVMELLLNFIFLHVGRLVEEH